MSLQTPPLGLYIHIPWCIKKCPYCDFNSHAVTGEVPAENYIEALIRDLDQDLPGVHDRRLASIFFGGGTPSLFSPDSIHTLIEAARARIDCAEDLEVTLEANPGTVEKNKFRGFKEAGVNRLSIGVQSFQPGHLRALGRVHSPAEAFRAAEEAHAAGIENFNLDLMYGLPAQQRGESRDDVQNAVALGPAHISYYQLTIEAHTFFSKNPPALPAEDEIFEMQCENQSFLRDHGYFQYEISAYARSGLQCRHNRNYWSFGDYLGIGAGAHAKITDAEKGTIRRTSKISHPRQYVETAGTLRNYADKREIPKQELGLEFLMNALRLVSGFEKKEFNLRTGLQLADLEPALSECLDEKLLEQTDTHIRATESGLNFLDGILTRFVPG